MFLLDENGIENKFPSIDFPISMFDSRQKGEMKREILRMKNSKEKGKQIDSISMLLYCFEQEILDARSGQHEVLFWKNDCLVYDLTQHSL